MTKYISIMSRKLIQLRFLMLVAENIIRVQSCS